MHHEIEAYNLKQSPQDQEICALLAATITHELPEAESNVWHAHPVWFIEGNPIVGYSKQKPGIRLMFWSGADFEAPQLHVKGVKFKDASIFYTSVEEITVDDLKNWLVKSRDIQWDYKNIVKKKGRLDRLKG